ncbi:MAG: hypothetical protein IKU32_04420 [Clostridia bacterium]|nr:hypothetical protein [Clostridia bacterium]
MKRIGMATHSISSFNESDAVRILSDILESKQTIKTFFKENDRTPNYDGSFEIIDSNGVPQKQFIVQIKKVENLTANIKGKNKGKYVYSLDTSFLYYVKAKVTESPAVYFVVDVVSKTVFWIYLSDELLMNLEFEGYSEISYPFVETDKLSDIDEFTRILKGISSKRNALFLNKTPAEIAEMQDAIDYINGLMDNDLAVIKKDMFPNLWRFGIRHSHTSSFSLTVRGETLTPDNTAAYALYPQIKGVADTGIKEYSWDTSGLFNHFDLAGKTTPIEYSKQIVKKIIKAYFEKGLPIDCLPDIVLVERVYPFSEKLAKIYDFNYRDDRICVDDLMNGFLLVAKYIQNVLLGQHAEDCEKRLRESLLEGCKRNRHNFFDMIEMCIAYDCKNSFKAFCKKCSEIPRFSPDVLFPIISTEYIRALMAIIELQRRKVDYIFNVWDYDYWGLINLSEPDLVMKVNEICGDWFSKLPELYNAVFTRLFEKDQYRFTGKYEYKNEYCGDSKYGPPFSSILWKYSDSDFTITYNPEIKNEFIDEAKTAGLKRITEGNLFDEFLRRKTLFYDSLTCLLYNGLCDGLQIKRENLSINGWYTSRGISLF